MKVLISVGLAIVAIGAAALATTLPHAWEGLAENRIVAYIRAATGETVRVAGDTRVTLLPAPSVTFEHVEIGSGLGERPSLRAASLRVSLQVLPLLSGQFEPRTVTLDNAEIRLDWEAEEEPRTALARLVRYLQHPLVAETRNTGVDTILLRDGRAWLFDERLGRVEEIAGIDLRFATGANQTPVKLEGSLQWRQQTIELSASLDHPHGLFTESGSAGDLTVMARPLEQTASAEALPDGDAPASSHPPDAPPTVGPFGVAGIFRITDGGAVMLDNANIAAPGAAAEGNVVLDLHANRPLLSGILEFSTFDLAPYISALLPLSYGDLLDVPLTPPWLRDVDIDITARVSRVYLGRLDFSQPTMRLHAAAGRTTLTLLETGFAGGQIRGRLAILPTAFGASIRLTGSVEHVSAGDIGRALWPAPMSMPASQLPEGTVYAEIALDGRGTTLGAALDTLDGWAVTVARNGSLGGADIVSTLQQLAAGNVLPGSGEPFMPVAGRTSFSTFIASATIRDGIVHLPLARFEGDRFEINLSGQARLIDGRLAAEGTASLDTPAVPNEDYPRGVQLPFGVGGTVREPVFAPGIPRIGSQPPLFATQASHRGPTSHVGSGASVPIRPMDPQSGVGGGEHYGMYGIYP